MDRVIINQRNMAFPFRTWRSDSTVLFWSLLLDPRQIAWTLFRLSASF